MTDLAASSSGTFGVNIVAANHNDGEVERFASCHFRRS